MWDYSSPTGKWQGSNIYFLGESLVKKETKKMQYMVISFHQKQDGTTH
jgi:hypothetical protein